MVVVWCGDGGPRWTGGLRQPGCPLGTPGQEAWHHGTSISGKQVEEEEGGEEEWRAHTRAHTHCVHVILSANNWPCRDCRGGATNNKLRQETYRLVWGSGGYVGGGCTSSDKRRSTRLNVPERDAYRAAAEFRRRDPPKIGTPGNLFFSSSPTRRGKIRTTKA